MNTPKSRKPAPKLASSELESELSKLKAKLTFSTDGRHPYDDHTAAEFSTPPVPLSGSEKHAVCDPRECCFFGKWGEAASGRELCTVVVLVQQV